MDTVQNKIDPRAGLFLLLIANIAIFNISSVEGIGLLLLYVSALMLYHKMTRATIRFFVVYFILFGLLRFILPNSPKVIAMSFSIMVNYALKMLPCLMIGYLIVKSMTMYEMITALRRMHCPEQLIISLSITLRYFPAIKEEIRYINDAMKLKNMNTAEKISSIIVPLMISATNTVDELSEAAITRGIDNPAKKTSMVDLKLQSRDYMISLFSVLIITILIILF
ncbi:energy-coupling factor transporter transmembrane protein EcfT [Clostridium sp. MSJ-11]|uniref:Energy-coupling factor transporter transmembrane protein EcfT n=1 Tax=Clostridium mobile TaxID=2841512 RepID=A0ABS6ELB7_9CLOT|nr:energy-coupling factor transporter transmembrane component T [Clostridium mobile]MBU5486016.1 energy-coupling factor transporter transmembrane protein EcfT [Clostridium mobile]